MAISLQINILHEKPLIAKLLCLLFAVLILLNLYSTLRDFKSIYSSSSNNSPDLTLDDNNNLRTLIKSGLNVDLFGKYMSSNFGENNIKKSILDIHVIGIIFSASKNNSEVLLRLPNGVGHVFKIDDIIPGGAKILSISPEGIVVEREGILERLNLPKEELIFDKQTEELDKNVID